MSLLFVKERMCYRSLIERDAIAEYIDFMLNELIHCQVQKFEKSNALTNINIGYKYGKGRIKCKKEMKDSYKFQNVEDTRKRKKEEHSYVHADACAYFDTVFPGKWIGRA